MVDMDTEYVGVVMVTGKSPDKFMVRSTASRVDKLRSEKARVRYDTEPAMRLRVERIAAFRHLRSAIFEPVNRASKCRWRGESTALHAHFGRTFVQGLQRTLYLDTHTLPMDVETCSMDAQSISVAKSPWWFLVENSDWNVLQKSFAAVHGNVGNLMYSG